MRWECECGGLKAGRINPVKSLALDQTQAGRGALVHIELLGEEPFFQLSGLSTVSVHTFPYIYMYLYCCMCFYYFFQNKQLFFKLKYS